MIWNDYGTFKYVFAHFARPSGYFAARSMTANRHNATIQQPTYYYPTRFTYSLCVFVFENWVNEGVRVCSPQGKHCSTQTACNYGVRAMTTLLSASFDYAQAPRDATEMRPVSNAGPVNTTGTSDPQHSFLFFSSLVISGNITPAIEKLALVCLLPAEQTGRKLWCYSVCCTLGVTVFWFKPHYRPTRDSSCCPLPSKHARTSASALFKRFRVLCYDRTSTLELCSSHN